MEKIETYDVNKRFDQHYKGEYTELDQKTEDKKQEELATKTINDLLLPKITKMVPVQETVTRMEKQVVEGKKLPTFDHVDPDHGQGY